MTPVISPWVFYLMPVCENVGNVLWGLALVGCMGLIFFSIGWLVEVDSWSPDEDKIKRYKSHCKNFLILAIVVGLVACLIPSEETITKMLIAQNVTYDRVEVVTDTVANVYNDIMNLFQDSGAANG